MIYFFLLKRHIIIIKDVTITAEFQTLFTWFTVAFCYGLGCDKAWAISLPSGAVQQHTHNEHTGHSSALMPTWPNSAT